MQFANLQAWQVLLAGLGSPLRTTTAGRIFFIGQLGKYIPGSVWPILTQMELGAAGQGAPAAVGQRLDPDHDPVAAHRPDRRRW